MMWKPNWGVVASVVVGTYVLAVISQLAPAASPAGVASKVPTLLK